MNDERLDDLIDAHFNGVMTAAERCELEARLLHSATDRARFWEMSEIHVTLHESYQHMPRGSERAESFVSIRDKLFVSIRDFPLITAASGVMFGMFCTSMVFAYVVPKMEATTSRLFSLVDGSFEEKSGRVHTGFPSEFGIWSGDHAEMTGGMARDQKQALRFLQAEREPALPDYGAASCDVYQLVDLRSLKADAGLGEATLELSAQFCDARPVTGEKVKFICRLYVFTGSPNALPAEWPLSQKDALASGSGTRDSNGGSVGTWHSVSTRVLMPPQADFAVVHLVLHQPKNPPSTIATFGEHFADDVRLTLKTQPTLPVRLSPR